MDFPHVLTSKNPLKKTYIASRKMRKKIGTKWITLLFHDWILYNIHYRLKSLNVEIKHVSIKQALLFKIWETLVKWRESEFKSVHRSTVHRRSLRTQRRMLFQIAANLPPKRKKKGNIHHSILKLFLRWLWSRQTRPKQWSIYLPRILASI